MSDQVIEHYQRGEEMMILIFAQWCINHELDPFEVYKRAYPNQGANDRLEKIMDSTVTKEESEIISDETVLNLLWMYGNEDLAFVISEIKK
ncbi:MAG: hypothetical protein LRY71_13035 [Bacillaceae bacterium]|nr:hypothetical protein [Bacillaceae bacterium]